MTTATPYVITTLPPGWSDYAKQYGVQEAADRAQMPKASRRAVATLKEARDVYLDTALRHGCRFEIVPAFPESGGTIGPLPDGTVIEVAHWTASALASWLPNGLRRERPGQGVNGHPALDMTTAEIIDAYNRARSRR